MSAITLTTDYGLRDHYVGVLKGVILGIAPKVRVIDISHDVEPHNVHHGAFVLWQIWSHFPLGTIHVAVVDPGVGTDRRILLGRYAGQYVIAPDNGLITHVHRAFSAEAMFVVENHRYFLQSPSTTFHGRDIMAPVAAHLATGVKPHAFGRATDRIELLAVSHRAKASQSTMRGAVLYVDRFGTIVTNVARDQVVGTGGKPFFTEVLVNGVSVGPVQSTFAEVPAGEPIALIGGGGLLEVAVNQGRAIDRFGPADSIEIELR